MSNNKNAMDKNSGNQIAVTGANPAAADDFVYTIPNYQRLELIALTFLLTTDANAANRYINLSIKRGANFINVNGSPTAHIASKGYIYSFNQYGADPLDLTTSNLLVLPLNKGLKMFPGDTLNIIVFNAQVGDQLSAINMTFDTWVTEEVA